MIYTELDSSMIDPVGYDEKAQVLEVRFISSGGTYRYLNVPKEEYTGLMQASSKGRYMLNNIIEGYDFYKIGGRKRRR